MTYGLVEWVQSSVLFICTEDGVEDTIVPRLIEQGANLHDIHVMNTVRAKDKTGKVYEKALTIPDDVPTIRKFVEDNGIVLVIDDNLMTSINAKNDTYKTQMVGQALSPVVRMCEETGVTFWAIRHLNRSKSDNLIYRGGGSMGIIGTARTSLMVLKHPDDENLRVLVNPKNNLAKNAPPLMFEVTSRDNTNGVPKVEWHGVYDGSLVDLVSTTKPSENRQLILNTLRAYEGPQGLTVPDIMKSTGIEKRTIVDNLLTRMVRDGEIVRVSMGRYTHLPSTTITSIYSDRYDRSDRDDRRDRYDRSDRDDRRDRSDRNEIDNPVPSPKHTTQDNLSFLSTLSSITNNEVDREVLN